MTSPSPSTPMRFLDLAILRSYFSAVVAPIERAFDAPAWGYVMGLAFGAWQWARQDMFLGLIPIVIGVNLLDYLAGVKAAKHVNQYNAATAHAGAVGKGMGILLLLSIRAVEGWAHIYAIVDTRGAIATAVAISLIAVDIRSVSQHREAFGAKPIPVLSVALQWIQDFLSSKFTPPSAGK